MKEAELDSTIKTPAKTLNITQCKHIQDWSMTLEEKSLYTQNKGVKAVRGAYHNHPTKTIGAKLIKFSPILTLSNFVFKSINYLQIMERAMGTICAPAYANFFMAQFEKITSVHQK